jgi:hypothetical protein
VIVGLALERSGPLTDLTPLQTAYIELAQTALLGGAVASGLIIFLLAVIAVRGLASW